jgi:hypothetical protein
MEPTFSDNFLEFLFTPFDEIINKGKSFRLYKINVIGDSLLYFI